MCLCIYVFMYCLLYVVILINTTVYFLVIKIYVVHGFIKIEIHNIYNNLYILKYNNRQNSIIRECEYAKKILNRH